MAAARLVPGTSQPEKRTRSHTEARAGQAGALLIRQPCALRQLKRRQRARGGQALLLGKAPRDELKQQARLLGGRGTSDLFQSGGRGGGRRSARRRRRLRSPDLRNPASRNSLATMPSCQSDHERQRASTRSYPRRSK